MLSTFLTFVVALHQVRLSDLYVEGFVLLVLLIVDYFHLDDFTEEAEDEGAGREEKWRRREEKNAEKVRKRTDWKLEKSRGNRSNHLAPKSQHKVPQFTMTLLFPQSVS